MNISRRTASGSRAVEPTGKDDLAAGDEEAHRRRTVLSVSDGSWIRTPTETQGVRGASIVAVETIASTWRASSAFSVTSASACS